MTPARRAWHVLEHVHAVTYFSRESRELAAQLGLRGFWQGYFAMRAAPLGPVPASVVVATFANFHPAMVARAIPDAWRRAAPETLLAARADAAAATLRRVCPDADAIASAASSGLAAAVGAADATGRALFAANRDVPEPAGAVAALWQLATCLREHRGDGHVAALVAADVEGCEAHVLVAALTDSDGTMHRDSRGWSTDDWTAATERLRRRGLVDGEGRATAAGRALHDAVEARTDELAWRPFTTAGRRAVDAVESLSALARAVAASGEIRVPNPMGLPALR